MSDSTPIRIAAQPESAEQAAQMIAHHKAGAYELVGGAVLGLPTAQGLPSTPSPWSRLNGCNPALPRSGSTATAPGPTLIA